MNVKPAVTLLMSTPGRAKGDRPPFRGHGEMLIVAALAFAKVGSAEGAIQIAAQLVSGVEQLERELEAALHREREEIDNSRSAQPNESHPVPNPIPPTAIGVPVPKTEHG